MTLSELVNIVNEHFDCNIRDNTRRRHIVMARASYFYLAKKKTYQTLKKIGAEVGRDHSTVMHSLANFDDWVEYDSFFKEKFENLKIKLFKNYNPPNMTLKQLLYKYNFLLIENDILKTKNIKLKNELREKK